MNELKIIIGIIIGFCLFFSCNSEDFLGICDKDDFISWYNSKLPAYIELCDCNAPSMCELFESDSDEKILWKINHNFREDVVHKDMTEIELKEEIIRYFKIPVRRFADAPKYATTVEGSYSIRFNEQYVSGEPSSLISDEGERIEVFSPTGYYFESSDGINWSEGQKLNIGKGSHLAHFSVNKVDGLYVMIGCLNPQLGELQYFDMYTSTDRINFEFRGHILSTQTDIGNGEKFNNLGNTYLLKDDAGKYCLLYEGATNASNWETCLMTCTNLFELQENGFIGDWEQCNKNPILPYAKKNQWGEVPQIYSNPEIVKDEKNQPLKFNGNYYMYYLSAFYKGNVFYATINRSYSKDLIHWTEEGPIFDNRDIPEGGEIRGDNGDQSLCQFKGKTYMFYTNNINSKGYSRQNIRYTIDDRSLIELLEIKP